MKSFAVDENPIDIEELCKLKCLNDKKITNSNKKNIHIINDSLEWFAPNSLDDLFNLLIEYQTSPYRLVGGNTGVGVYKNDGPYQVFIDVKHVPDLYQVYRNPNFLTIGSSVQIKSLIDIMTDYSTTNGYEYLSVIAHHFSKIANVSVRNTGSWSGNLMLKYNHQDFPSDVFVCFETIGAAITIVGPDKLSPPIVCSTAEFLSLPSLTGKLVYSVSFTPFNKAYAIIKTYKIMPRSQNAHAYVSV